MKLAGLAGLALGVINREESDEDIGETLLEVDASGGIVDQNFENLEIDTDFGPDMGELLVSCPDDPSK